MTKNEFNKLLDESIKYNDELNFNKSLSILFDCLDKYLQIDSTKGLSTIYCHIANNFYDLEQLECSLYYYNLGLKHTPNDELSSLGKYIVLVDMKRSEDAFHELIRFLENNPAELYKVTLEELLEDLKNGYMKDFESEIKNLAKNNGILYS